MLAIVAATYVACFTFAATRTMISFGPRFVYPIFPVVLVLSGMAITGIEHRVPSISSQWRWRSLWSGVAVIFAVLHLSLFFRASEPGIHDAVAERLDQPFAVGATARQVIMSLAGSDGVVMANVGQATGFILQRPTVSLVSPEFSSIE